MDTLPNPAEMTDLELIREWECLDCDAEDKARSETLAAELRKRKIEF